MISANPLDHLGVAVHDLAAARDTYTRLGFNVTPLSVHSGQNAQGQVQAFGSGNHCTMFKRGYLELIGIVDPEKPSSVASFLSSRHGGFITALGVENAEKAYERASTFPTAQRPVLLQRYVDHNGQQELVQFRNVLLGGAFPETRLLMIEHVTPELIWRPEYLKHPNGVVALAGAQFLVEDSAEAAARYAQLADGEVLPMEGGGHRLQLDGQELQFFTADSSYPHENAHCPSLCGAIFRVEDIEATANCLERNGVRLERVSNRRLVVSPDLACGFSLTFIS